MSALIAMEESDNFERPGHKALNTTSDIYFLNSAALYDVAVRVSYSPRDQERHLLSQSHAYWKVNYWGEKRENYTALYAHSYHTAHNGILLRNLMFQENLDMRGKVLAINALLYHISDPARHNDTIFIWVEERTNLCRLLREKLGFEVDEDPLNLFGTRLEVYPPYPYIQIRTTAATLDKKLLYRKD